VVQKTSRVRLAGELAPWLAQAESAAQSGDAAVRALLRQWVPEFAARSAEVPTYTDEHAPQR
jgi:hypothetical protein